MQAVDSVMDSALISIDDLAFATTLGLEIGFDVVDDLPQERHVCWPYGSYQGALCSTKRLWGHAGPLADEYERLPVTCVRCANLLHDLRTTLPPIAALVISKLAANLRSANAVDFAVSDALWILDNPKKVKELAKDASVAEVYSLSDPWKPVREALAAHEKFHADQFGGNPPQIVICGPDGEEHFDEVP